MSMKGVSKRQTFQVDSSDDEQICVTKRKIVKPLDSDASDEETEKLVNSWESTNEKLEIKDDHSFRDRKLRRFVESSDDEKSPQQTELSATPKAERLKKLREMNKKVRVKKKIYSDSSEESETGSYKDESDKPWLNADEDNLPMFEHEEKPPEIEEIDEESTDESDFIVPDDEEVEEDRNIGVKTKRKHKSKVDNSNKAKVHDLSELEGEEDSFEVEDADDECSSYANPYLEGEMNEEDDLKNIVNILSKNTDKDRKNAKKYKKEIGKYQFSIKSEKNKAALVSNRARFNRNMGSIKFDKGLKEERNLDVKDSEYFEFIQTSAYGESVRIFPHTKKVSGHKNSKCSLSGCGEKFVKGVSWIVGVTKFCSINFQYLKKQNQFGKETFYYVCACHLPKFDCNSDQYSSGSDSDL
jgi:hypothetical protein